MERVGEKGMNRIKWLRYGIGAGLVVMVALGGLAWRLTGGEDAPRYRFAKVEKGALTSTVSASGTLAPVTQVQVGSQISGQIKEIRADFNSEVKAGDIIARIDPDSYEARVAQANAELEVARAAVLMQQASLDRARADVLNAQAGLLSSRADTTRAEVTAKDAEREFQRKRDLSERGIAAAADKDRQEAAAQSAVAQVRGSRAQELARQAALSGAEAAAKMAEAQLANATASVKQKEAALRQAQIDLDRTVIRSPVDGVVILRNIDAGQTVAASLQAPVLFNIAETLSKMQVETAVDEADIGRLAEGMDASFTVDSIPGRTFEGVIRQIRKSPQVVQNVVSYIVVIAADNPDQRLLPGMTANVRIIAAQREQAVKIPNAALRFRPPALLKPENADGKPAQGGENENGGQGQAQGGPSGNAVAMRERLVKQLNLDEAQQRQLGQIFLDLRQKMLAIPAEADEAQRRVAQERARAESRARIADMLNAEQRARFTAINAVVARSLEGRVHVLRNGKLVALTIRTGISDGAYTEMIGPQLKEGDELVVGVTLPAGATAAAASGNSAPRLRL